MSLFLSFYVFLCVCRLNGQNLTKPTEAHLLFYRDNVGAIIHFNMQTFVPKNQRKCCNTWNPDKFDPYLLNTDEWLKAAQSFGAKYAVMVTDHFSGFSMYPTTAHNYSVKYSSWLNGTGNVVKSFVESAYKYNIRPAIYYSVHENWYYNVSNFNLSNATLQQQFQNMALTQLNEISTIYKQFGDEYVAEIWFDAGVKQALSFVDQVQSFVLSELGINATCHSCENMPDVNGVHWMGNEEANMPYPNWGANTIDCGNVQGDPYGARYCPPHCDAVLREHIWFWEPNPPPVSSTTSLVMKYLTSVGRACNLILDIAPNMTGSLLQDDVIAYKQFGDAINLMLNNDNVTFVNVSNPVINGMVFDLNLTMKNNGLLGIGGVELMEDITNGQRIKTHSIEIYSRKTNIWYNLTKTSNSLTIGHKRIQTYNVTELNVYGDILRISIKSFVGPQSPELIQMASIKMFDWTELSQNQLSNLQWSKIIAAGS